MSLLRSRSFALRKLIVNGRFCSRRLIGLLVAAISVTAMLLTSASSVKTAPLRVSPAPIAAPGTNEQPTPERGAGQPALSWRNLRRPNIPVSPGTWIAEGPGPIQNGQAVAAPNNGVAGAIKAIAAHPSNPDILYVGTVNGGVWKTTNAVAASPTWTPLTDNEKSLSIGALKFDPTDAASNTLIAGIGRFSSLNSVGGPRSGLLLTTDGGITWSALDGGGVLAGANISGVAARGSIILAGVDRAEHNACVNIGIFRSENTGTSFTRISGAARSGLPFGSVLDLAEEPTGIIPHGVVMTSDGTGGVQEWSNNGNFINTIQTLKMQDAGSAFDAAGNFYVTDFGAEGVTAFDPRGRLIGQVGQAPGYKLPESIVQDGAGHFFIGNAGDGYLDPTTPFTEKCKQDSTQPNYPPCPVYEFDPTFTSLIRTFLPDTEKRGTDWTAIANDQCTMLYTSEGTSIKAFNVCSGTQLADFTTGLPGPNAYELGISPTGEVFVADADEVVRLNSHGRVIQRYTGIGGTQKQPLFAMRFDPDGSSIWTANLITSDVYKLDIDTGKVLVSFNTGGPFLSGLTVKSSPLYAAIIYARSCGGGANGIYKSMDSGATWKLVSNAAMNALFIDGTTNNVKIALGTAGNVYVGIENNGQLAGLFRSGDGGLTWTALVLPTTAEMCATFGINPGKQGGIHFSIAADPNNPDVVYVGGDRQPGKNEGCVPQTAPTFPNSIGANNFTGRLFRVSGGSFAHLTDSRFKGPAGGGTAKGTSPHAGSRGMVFDANGSLLEVDDGGIFRRTSPISNAGDWLSLNGNLQVTELHDLAYDRNSQIIFGGAQDTGAAGQVSAGSLPWTEPNFLQGDGGDVGVDETSSFRHSIRYESSTYMSNFSAQSFNAANVLQGTTFPSLTPLAGSPAFTTQFYTPIKVNAINPLRLLFGFANGLYESADQGSHVTALAPAVATNDGFGHSALVYGGRSRGTNNANLIYVGTGNMIYQRTGPPGTALTRLTGYQGASPVNGIAVDPFDYTDVYAIDRSHVHHSSNCGASWTDITGNLGTFNAGDFESVEFFAQSVIIGTHVGAFQALKTNLQNWSQLGTGLPNAPVYGLSYDPVAAVLVPGTVGRGAWKFKAPPTPTHTATTTPTRIHTPTATPRSTLMPTPTRTSTSVTPTRTKKVTSTPTKKPMATSTRKRTPTPTRKRTPTSTRKPTPTSTRKPTPTSTRKRTPTPF